jgi:Tfp pilus assembly protein PilO
LVLVAYLMVDSLQSMGQQNRDMRDALDAIAKHSDEYRDGKARAAAQALRIGSEPPQLAADLEAAAKEAGIQIPETADRPDAAAGKRYVEHSLDLKLRKVDLKSLATFLGKVETSRRLILITRLEIRRSFGGDGTSVDVDLTATTYERLKDGSKKPAGKGGPAAGKGKG